MSNVSDVKIDAMIKKAVKAEAKRIMDTIKETFETAVSDALDEGDVAAKKTLKVVHKAIKENVKAETEMA